MEIKSNWLIIGIALFSLLLGLLTGASNTPMAGATVSSVFGVLVILIGFLKKEKGEKLSIAPQNLRFAGKSLVIFSILMFTGLLVGENYRNNRFEILKEKQIIPWEEVSKPDNTYEAIDWLLTSKKLRQLGYSESQIKLIYKIRIEEIKTKKQNSNEVEQDSIADDLLSGYNGLLNDSEDEIYDVNNPFNEMISSEVIQKLKSPGRGPASVDD